MVGVRRLWVKEDWIEINCNIDMILSANVTNNNGTSTGTCNIL
jgi:hypothetical protein